MELLRQWGVVGLLAIVGLGLVGYGLWQQIKPTETVVEIIKGHVGEQKSKNSEHGGSQVVVDVAGAVEQPGVYTLPSGSRIGDVLVVAGGLSASADREWVARTLNLAEPVKDAQKIFIPTRNESNNQSPSTNLSAQAGNQTNTNNKNNQLINVNTASVGELDTLPGIGSVRAQAIVDNRPYGSTEEIVTRAKVPQSVYEEIKDSLTIY